MAKIQVSTVEMKSQAQVIVLNTSFVAKAMRAQFALQDAMNHMPCNAEDMCEPVKTFINELVDALLDEDEDEKQKPECQTEQGEE